MTISTPKEKKILIVEDEPDVAAYLEMLLHDAGYATISAQDGREGMEKVKTEKPDLVTLDIVMAEATGTRFYKEIRTDPETSSIPVVIVTAIKGYGGDPYGYEKFISGRRSVPPPDGFFPKPIDKDAFLTTVGKLLE
jgi:two-component system cell cycle response regulator DivK